MINFLVTDTGVELEYAGDLGTNNQWIWENLKKDNEARVSSAFSVISADLLNPPSATQDFEVYRYRFQLGHFEDDYVRIPGRILNSKKEVARGI